MAAKRVPSFENKDVPAHNRIAQLCRSDRRYPPAAGNLRCAEPGNQSHAAGQPTVYAAGLRPSSD